MANTKDRGDAVREAFERRPLYTIEKGEAFRVGLETGGAVLWSMKTIAGKLGIAVRTLERLRAEGRFPEPDFRLNAKIIRWCPETVQAWLERARELAAER